MSAASVFRIVIALNVAVACAWAVVGFQRVERDGAWVDRREAEWTIRPSERAVEGIRWVDDLQQAMQKAREQKRLVLVVVSNGAMTSGRI